MTWCLIILSAGTTLPLPFPLIVTIYSKYKIVDCGKFIYRTVGYETLSILTKQFYIMVQTSDCMEKTADELN
jgi:hypothetical protein